MPVRPEQAPGPVTDLEQAARKIKDVGRSLDHAMGEFHSIRCRRFSRHRKGGAETFMLDQGEIYLSESMDKMLNVMGATMDVLENLAKSARYLASA